MAGRWLGDPCQLVSLERHGSGSAPKTLRCNRKMAPARRWRDVATRAADARLEAFPPDYEQAIKQAQKSVSAAMADGCKLIEIEFPAASLSSVSGDAEGVNEMTWNMEYMKSFVNMFAPDQAQAVRIFFPDQKELMVAKQGKGIDPNAGSWEIAPIFRDTKFQLDFLTRPTALLDMGLDINKIDVAARAKPTDNVFVIAYPHFNVNEIIAVSELWEGAARETERPIIVFNGELDRIRSGYYPALFYPKLGKLNKEFLPLFTQAFYIHNFKGSYAGALFRAYPGPWQVLRRNPYDTDEMVVVHTQDTMPSLKEVALNILPNS